MVKIEIKQQELARELERIERKLQPLVDKIRKGDLSASEYAQTMAEYNIWLSRYDKVDTEIRLMRISPSKRTEMTGRNLRLKD